MPDDPPPGFRKPVTLGDMLRAAAQQQPQVPAELFDRVKAIPPIEMPHIGRIEMPQIPPIEIPPAVFRIHAELQQILDRLIGPAEAAPAPPEQSSVARRHILSDADQKVLDHLMQLPVWVTRAKAKAAAKERGYGRHRFERIWPYFPDDRKHPVGAPKRGAKA